MEVLGFIILVIFILIMLVLLVSFLWIAFIDYRLQNKTEQLLETKGNELITEDNLNKIGSKFQRKMVEVLKKREENFIKTKK